MNKNYYILLYYCYTPIRDYETFRETHHLFCLKNNLRGRIIIAPEGINGTLSGLKKDCETYMKALYEDVRFEKTEFKIEEHFQHAFSKLHVRVKPEIVNSGLKGIDEFPSKGNYIEPHEFKKILKEEKDTLILDVRSNYETHLGRFKNAITLNIEHFRDFSKEIKKLEKYKNKKVVTYCTGGIKCEKASAFLKEKGFENVYQLHGGIIKYGIEEKGEDFEGACYVFDNRIAVEVNKVNPKIVSSCYITGAPTTRMVNCANPHCNRHIPMSEKGAEKYKGNCSEKCMLHPDTRLYDGTGYYAKQQNGYDPYKNSKRKTKIN